MHAARLFVTSMLALLLSAFAPASTGPATAPAGVPEAVYKEIQDQFVPPENMLSREEMLQVLTERMRNVIRLGSAAEDKYSQAENINRVRMLMLRAASFLANRDEEGAQGLLLIISRRVMDSKAPPEMKVEADRILTTDKLKGLSGQTVEQEIKSLAARYEKTPAAWAAVAYAADLAGKNRQPRLREQLLDVLEKEYIQADPEVRSVLRKAGRPVDVGRTFEAELTRLDGTRLQLPRDLLNKVAVIDFWASWCPPCAGSAPELKKVYDKFKSQGVEFVGISLDRDRQALQKFVKEHGLNWIHTFSGKAWEDPTAVRYGIRAIPNIWVIGRDGKVLSSDARAHLEEEIQKALDAKKD